MKFKKIVAPYLTPDMVFALCWLIAVLLPWHVHPFRSFYHDWLTSLGLILGLAFAARQGLRMPGSLAFSLGLIVFILLQTLLLAGGMNTSLIFSLAYLLLAALALMFGASRAADPQSLSSFCRALAWVMLAAGMLSFCMQAVQLAGVNVTPWVMYILRGEHIPRPYANLGQPNQLALLQCFAIAALIYLHLEKKLTPILSLLFLLALLTSLMLTLSRIAWLILPGFVCLMAYAWRGLFTQAQRSVALALLGFYFLSLWLYPKLLNLNGQVSVSVTERLGGHSERLALWRQAWVIAQEHIWLGAGWTQYGYQQVLIAADSAPGTYAEHAHNWVLNFAAELGWPVTLIFFAGLAYWIWQACVRAEKTPTQVFACLCLFATAVHSMVEFPLWYAYILLPMAVLMGVLHQLRWPGVCVCLRKPWPGLGGAAALAVLLGVTWDYQRVVAGFTALREQLSGARYEAATMNMPGVTLFGEFFEYFQLMQLSPREGMRAVDIAYVEKWAPRFGFVHILNKQAEVYVLNGQIQNAQRTMLALQRLHPFLYADYYDYWQAKAKQDTRYQEVFTQMPTRE